jgi:PAS domain S-box-containing protein
MSRLKRQIRSGKYPSRKQHKLLTSQSKSIRRHDSPGINSMNGHLAQQVLDANPNIVYIYDLYKQHCIYINPQVTQILGYTSMAVQAMTAATFLELIDPEDQDLIKQYFHQWKSLRTGAILEWECRVKHADGHWKWLRSQETILQSTPEGLPWQISGTAQDITHLKQAEQGLRSQLYQEQLIEDITRHIRQSLDLKTILQTTVQEVREFLKADRVLVYRFLPCPMPKAVLDNDLFLPVKPAISSTNLAAQQLTSIVVVEACLLEFSSLLGWTIGDSRLDQKWYIQPFCGGEIRAIANIAQSTLLDSAYKQLLENFEVKAQIDIPIVKDTTDLEQPAEHLWGLLVVQQCRSERAWQTWEIDLLRRLENQLAVAIQQSELYNQLQQFNAALEAQVEERTTQLQQALEFEAVIKRITEKVRDSLNEKLILQTAVEELAIAFDARGCNASLYDLKQNVATVRYEYTTSNLPSEGVVVCMEQFSTLYQALLQQQSLQFCPLSQTETHTRAAILACPIFDHDGILGDLWLLHQPRHIFSQPEIRLMQQVANQCAIALRQSHLYQEARAQVKALEKLNHLKDDFLSTISHELRTPLSSIKMAVQLLERIFKDCFGYALAEVGFVETTTSVIGNSPETASDLIPLDCDKQSAIKAAHCLKILQEESDREINLINDLLTLQQLEAGTQPFIPSLIHLQNWIPQITETFEERFRDHQQTLHLNLPPDLPPLSTDLYMFNHILGELLTNAYKFTPPGETITISAQMTIGNSPSPLPPPIPYLILTLTNSGIAIPQEELSFIFNRFYRIPSSDPWKYGGTGLGLALVQKLTTYLGGWVWAESDSKETRFIVQLPLNNESSFP